MRCDGWKSNLNDKKKKRFTKEREGKGASYMKSFMSLIRIEINKKRIGGF